MITPCLVPTYNLFINYSHYYLEWITTPNPPNLFSAYKECKEKLVDL